MQKPLMIFIAAGFLIAGIFMFLNRSGPCDGIFEQTAPSLSVKVASLKANGEWAIGPEKVQDVSEGAQKIAVHLKSCCISQQSGYMKPEQYQVCVSGAKDYEAKIIQITNIVKEADTAKQQGNTQVAEQKAAEAKTTVDASTAIERNLGKLAAATQTARPAPAIGTPKPPEEAKAVIKVKNGKSVVVDAKTVSTKYTWCGVDGLTLDYGQHIPFKNIQSFAVLDEKATIEIVPLNGEHLTGSVSSDCELFASNEVGPFETKISNIVT